MYFHDKKSNTNIDNDFDNKQNILSSILSFISKYKKIIIISSVALISLIVILFLTSNMRITIAKYLELNGEEIVTIYQDSDYIEPGYRAYNSKDEDLKSEVVVETNLNNKVIGEYEIMYTLGDITKIRIVNVIAKPKEYTYIHLTSVEKGTTDVYVKAGEKYVEPGYMVFSSTGTDLTSQVIVSGNVDTTKKGIYKLIYSVLDSSGVTISTSRTIIVLDADINLSLSTSSYTNKEVTINIEIIDEYFDYLILPNDTKITENKYTYKVIENGKYTFKTTNKKGMEKIKTIEVKNIDKTSPTGSCTGSYKDGVSSINITAKDNIGISQYVINNKSYTSNKITINSELNTVTITIYDKANNTNNISCKLEDKNDKMFDKNITHSYEYVKKSKEELSYALYTPSTASTNSKTPLIVWLHGSGEVGASQSAFKKSGLLAVINKWSLEPFNAYILCPQLSSGSWGTQTNKNKFYNLLEEIIQTKNINRNKIILTGHSLGGIGVYEIANGKTDYYSSFAVMSGYNTSVDLTQYQNIPTKGFVGKSSSGEDPSSYSHMINKFANTFGKENLTIFEVSHGYVPRKALIEDKNNDNRSDLIEWMLTQEKNKR